MTPVLEYRSVAKRFPNGVVAVDGVSLRIEPGEFVVILGPSGAGKSTLLRLANGLETTTSGSVAVEGVEVTRRTFRQVRARAAMVFQQFHLVGRLNVVTNVLCGRLSHTPSWMAMFHMFRSQDIERARDALARVGLTEKAWERADRLSGGQQQRVGIARAMVQQPALILADEPVASLDPATATGIMDLLAELNRTDRITVVVNLHQVELAKRYARRLIGLREGRVVLDGRPDELTHDGLRSIYGDKMPEEASDANRLAVADA